MKDKKSDDFDFELHMELTNKANKKKLEDTLDFYKENLPLDAVEKLYDKNQMANENEKSNFKSNSSYSKFISKYNENDNENSVKNNAYKSKKHRRSVAESEFLNGIHDKHDVFDYDYTRPKNFIGKVFVASLFVVFLCIIAALIFKIDSLNNQIADMKSQVEENAQAKETLQKTLIENENMKKMIEDLSNKKEDENESQDESQHEENNSSDEQNKQNETATAENKDTEYVVQKGDTLSSISKKFYGNSNSYNKIIERNKLSSENLSENQKLIIPQ